MISDNPQTGAAYGSFTVPERKPVYWVVEARRSSSCVFVCVGDAQSGPVAARLSSLDSTYPRIEFGDAWQSNSPQWKESVYTEALRVFREATGAAVRQCEG